MNPQERNSFKVLQSPVVMIINTGGLYSSYDEMARHLGASNWKSGFISLSELRRPFKLITHDKNSNICLVESILSGFQYLIEHYELRPLK